MAATTRGRRIRWSVSVIGLLLAGAGVFLWASRNPSEAAVLAAGRQAGVTPPEPSVARIQVARALLTDLPLRAEATGYLEPWRKVEIQAEAPGRVLQRTVEEGGYAALGSLLVVLDDREQRVAQEEAQAEWLKSQASYAVNFQAEAPQAVRSMAPAGDADDEIRRLEHLAHEGLVSKQTLDEARRRFETEHLLSGARQGDVRAASSGLAQAEQRVERSRLALERTRIRAPFSGRVADLAVEAGQQIAPGQNLMTLLEDDRLKVDVDVLEADIVRIRRGAPARVRIPSAGGLVLDGTVYTINPRIKPETGTGRVTVAIPNPRHLLVTGLFASIELETDRLRGRLVVPASALLARQGRDLVFRIDHGKALWTYVQVGKRSGDLVEIVDGLKPEDVVATAGHFALAHEAPVEAVSPQSSQPDARP
jgi:RND family efflux transporter MFP subunit